MVFDSIAKAKSFKSDDLKKYIESQADYMGVQGRYVWGGEQTYGIRHQWIAPFFVGQVKNGAEVMRTKIEP
jgi:hypothetical protein